MVDSTRSRIGTVLAGKYRLDREIGKGGMGAVYRAFHLKVHKEFAVKLLLNEVAEHHSIAQRFLLEAQAAGVALILTGHYASERFAVEALAGILGKQFPPIRCWAGRREADPLRWLARDSSDSIDELHDER